MTKWDINIMVKVAIGAGEQPLLDIVLKPFLTDLTQLSKILKQLAACVAEADGLKE